MESPVPGLQVDDYVERARTRWRQAVLRPELANYCGFSSSGKGISTVAWGESKVVGYRSYGDFGQQLTTPDCTAGWTSSRSICTHNIPVVQHEAGLRVAKLACADRGGTARSTPPRDQTMKETTNATETASRSSHKTVFPRCRTNT